MYMYILLGIIVLLVVDCVIWLIYEGIIAIYRKTALRYEPTHDVAKVVDKYDGLQFMLGGVPYYEVYILYKGKKHCFYDEDLYEKVKVGDTVHILVHKGFNKYGELKHTYLSIKD